VVILGFGFAMLDEVPSFSSPKEYRKRRGSFRQFRSKDLTRAWTTLLCECRRLFLPDLKDKDDWLVKNGH